MSFFLSYKKRKRKEIVNFLPVKPTRQRTMKYEETRYVHILFHQCLCAESMVDTVVLRDLNFTSVHAAMPDEYGTVSK